MTGYVIERKMKRMMGRGNKRGRMKAKIVNR